MTTPIAMRVIAAPNCTLEPLVAAHAAEMFVALSDPAIYEFENEPPPSEAWLSERYARLERRTSPDGAQAWLNWVVRLPGGELAGYVQATVLGTGTAVVAYELGSRWWRRGIGRAAVAGMLEELRVHHGVWAFAAVLKRANLRSHGLLLRLGFREATAGERVAFGAGDDERVMVREAASPDGPGTTHGGGYDHRGT